MAALLLPRHHPPVYILFTFQKSVPIPAFGNLLPAVNVLDAVQPLSFPPLGVLRKPQENTNYYTWDYI